MKFKIGIGIALASMMFVLGIFSGLPNHSAFAANGNPLNEILSIITGTQEDVSEIKEDLATMQSQLDEIQESLGSCEPTTETCDGQDNDCDGLIDEGNPGGAVACSTGLDGACSAGSTVCESGVLICEPNVSGTAETCDGLDNDCDGSVDEGNPGGGSSCNTGLLGVCASGTSECSSGTIECTQTAFASSETCDGLDNDCDGSVDEGNPEGGSSCNTGEQGVCADGTLLCSGGGLICSQNTSPSPEACDGLDNDCDGSVDEGNPGGGSSCDTGLLGVCASGTILCSEGGLVCEANTSASSETCDGLDNDCDGSVDEGNPGGGTSCDTGLPGICAEGTLQCSEGGLSCEPDKESVSEICGDDLDNNCDGSVDEGC